MKFMRQHNFNISGSFTMQTYGTIEKSTIDRILEPVIQTVRDNKINSFIQLKNFQTRASQNRSYIFQPHRSSYSQPTHKPSKTFTFGFPIKHVQKQVTSTPKTARAKIESNPEQLNFIPFSFNRKQETRSSNTSHSSRQRPNKQDQKRRVLRVNSKVKKHLIEKINFDDIERCLYQKRQCLTRYDYFMEMKSRQKEFHAENNKVLFKNRTYHWEKGEEIKNHGIQDLQLHVDKGQTLNVRSTPRKKFWVKEQAKKPNMTLFDKSLAFVEGKAYKTIET